MKRLATLGACALLLSLGIAMPAEVHAEPPPAAPPIPGLGVGLYYQNGLFGSWYDTLVGSGTATDASGAWMLNVPNGLPNQSFWSVIDLTGTNPTVPVHGDLYEWINGNNYALNGVTATLWADRNFDGTFGPASADGPWLDQDVTHCVAPGWCGDYALEGSDGSYTRGVTLEIGVPAQGVTRYRGNLWYP